MYYPYNPYPYEYWPNTQRHMPDPGHNCWHPYPCPYYAEAARYDSDDYITFEEEAYYDIMRSSNDEVMELRDYGPEPYVVNINEATIQNDNFRTALWTGNHLQLTLMSIDVGEDIGLEIHPKVDQFLRIEEGQGVVRMGERKDKLDFEEKVYDDFAIFIPAGTWHNVINTGDRPLKLYSIYAPPNHPRGTVHETKAEAEAAEAEHRE